MAHSVCALSSEMPLGGWTCVQSLVPGCGTRECGPVQTSVPDSTHSTNISTSQYRERGTRT
eukprot:160575-Rhodomonas_salina.1